MTFAPYTAVRGCGNDGPGAANMLYWLDRESPWLSNLVMLWWCAATAVAATGALVFLAMSGSVERRAARLMAAAAVGAIAVSYLWEIGPFSHIAPYELRRGASVVLWPATAWLRIVEARRR